MPRCFFACSLVLLLVCPAFSADTIRDSVVQLHVTKRAPDMFRPWTKASPSKVTGSGAIISGNRILTNAHVVRYASQVFIQLNQGGDQIPAKVTAIAPRMDLALVELEDPSQIEEIAPLEISDELPAIKSTVNVYGYPMGGDDLSVTEGIVSRIEFKKYYYDGAGLRIQVDAALNSGNSGGPAMMDGKIIGLVFSGIKEAENIGYIIPAEEVQTFLADVADGTYEGKPQLFDQFYTCENSALRSYLKLPSDETGVLVTNPYRDDEDYPLKSWDVITHVGPHDIDNQGDVDFNGEIRLRFLYYISKCVEDGHVPLKVHRHGESLDVKVPVSADREMLLYMLRNGYPRYFIYGPIVFTAVSSEHVRAMGSKGMSYLYALDSPILKRMSERPSFAGEELVMIATRLFPHRITKGYRPTALAVVTHLNDEPLKNLRHFAELLKNCQDEFIRFDLAGRSESLVFRRSEIEASTEEILTDEGIRYQCSKDLRDVWE